MQILRGYFNMALWNSTDAAPSKPKNLTADEKAITFGVDVAEASANRATNGVRTPGWNKYVTYTDSNGNVRHKSECLVVMSSMTLDAEDAVIKGNLVTITVAPLAQSVTAPAVAVFTVTATVNNGDTLAYQWQKSEAGASTWSNVGTNSSTYTTPATVAINDNGDRYRCVVSALSAPAKTTKAVKLTVV